MIEILTLTYLVDIRANFPQRRHIGQIWSRLIIPSVWNWLLKFMHLKCSTHQAKFCHIYEERLHVYLSLHISEVCSNDLAGLKCVDSEEQKKRKLYFTSCTDCHHIGETLQSHSDSVLQFSSFNVFFFCFANDWFETESWRHHSFCTGCWGNDVDVNLL